MPTNIELKARLRDRKQIERMVAQRATGPPEDMRHEDTFFTTNQGRLKLRVIDGAHGELIHYDRVDEAGPKSSRYRVVPVENATGLRGVLADALGERATVSKTRRVYMVGNTRVHLDTLPDLGEFIELEVVLTDGQSKDDGVATARRLMADLGIVESDLIAGAYVDLLETRADRQDETPA